MSGPRATRRSERNKDENDEIDGKVTFEISSNDDEDEEEAEEKTYISEELLKKASAKSKDLEIVTEIISDEERNAS